MPLFFMNIFTLQTQRTIYLSLYLVCLIGMISAVSFDQKPITTPLFDQDGLNLFHVGQKQKFANFSLKPAVVKK